MVYLIEVDTRTNEPVYPVWMTRREATPWSSPTIRRPANTVTSSTCACMGSDLASTDSTRRSSALGCSGYTRTGAVICRSRVLLDVAHIVDDAELEGRAIVGNGLALCRIHHGAIDQFLLGIRPNLVIEVSRDVLDEVDGPMLRHALQEAHGQRIGDRRSGTSSPIRIALPGSTRGSWLPAEVRQARGLARRANCRAVRR
jgi:hypothetical protein